MAKDVIKKKQRIAHNKTNEGHALCSEYNDDILSTIMAGMNNNNLLSMCSSNFDTDLPVSTKVCQEKTQSCVNQIPARNINVTKSKKFGIARKGPLMEKSQRALKQIQHNRKQPKPRAHLAGLSSSPPLENLSVQNVKAKSVNNVKNTSKFQNKKANEELTYNKTVIAGKTVERDSIQASTNNKINSKKAEVSKMKEYIGIKESSHIVENVTKKSESAYVKKNCSVKKTSQKVNNSDKINNSSDSDEYEKFIRKEKNDLPKKSKNKKRDNEKSRKSLKVTRKRTSKPVSESDSDTSDDESHYSCRRSKRTRKNHDMLNTKSTVSKKEKVSQKVNKKCISNLDSGSSDDEANASSKSSKKKKLREKINSSSAASKADSESEMDINNESYHNSSSESDELPSPSQLYGLPSANKFSENISEEDNLLLPSNSHAVDNSASVICTDKPNILSNSTSSLKVADNAAFVNSKQSNIFHSEITRLPLVGNNNEPNVLLKSSDIHTSVNSSQLNLSLITPKLLSSNGEDVALQNNVESRNSRQENLAEPLIIDLAESDNDENETSSSTIPKIPKISCQNQDNSQSQSEESDVELVNVVVPPHLREEVERLKKNVSSNCTNRSDELNIKIEKVCSAASSNGNVQSTKSSSSESQTPLTKKKYEVAYATDICRKYGENFQNENNVLHHSIVAGGFGKIKKEPSDAFKVNPDTVSTNNLSLPNKKIEGSQLIKVERISEVKQATSSSLNLASKQVHGNVSVKVEKDSQIKQTSSHAFNPISTMQSSDATNSKDLLVSKIKVKEEPCDDCEIVLDSVSSNTQIPINNSIKVERDSKTVKQVSAATHTTNDVSISSREVGKIRVKEENSCEIPCSSTTSHNETVQPMGNERLAEIDIKALLDLLKKEFITYTEIIETEHSVESTLKLLEKVQADRVKSLQTRILQNLEHIPSESCEPIKKAIDKLLNIPELNCSTSVEDGIKLSSVCPNGSSSKSDISVQDLKTLANIKLVPLSSIPENDIKPNLSELQCIVKKEPSSSYEIDNMSFGQKCIVCAKEASAACQQCAKVFYCSNECGRKYWEDGHKNTCVK